METRTRTHRRQNVQTRLKENLIILAVVVAISLWAMFMAAA